MGRILLYCAVAVMLLLVHYAIVPYLALAHVVPDVMLIFVICLAVLEGRLLGTIAGFVLGLVLDLTGGETAVLGLSALTKSISGFVAGLYFGEVRSPQTLGSYRLIILALLVSLVHNIIYFVIYLQGTDISLGDAVFFHAIPGALYTALVSLLPTFFFSRKYAGQL
jgi:rod shape-determining protein MreD